MQIQTWLKNAQAELDVAQSSSARLDALLLLESALQKSREWILAHNEHTLEPAQLKILNTRLARRTEHLPLAYLIGSKEFYGYNFLVNENVLIPRPETETIIELLKTAVSQTMPNTIIDLGTGSGCLAITAKLLYPQAHVSAIDNSSAALKVARQNAKKHGVQIQFKNMDITKKLPQMPQTRPYIMLANLPYVPAGMVTSAEITKEPAEALFSGQDGLSHYREFWQQAAMLKHKPYAIITESLKNQHSALVLLAQQAGYELTHYQDLIQLFTLKK